MIPILSPRTRATYYEYAIAVGEICTVLNRTRYNTYEDAYFDSVIRNNIDREKFGRVLIKRQVVRRKVVIGDWQFCDPNKHAISKKRRCDHV